MKKKTAVSKKQGRFLNEFLKTKSLEELLPLYTVAVSKNSEIFKILPEDLTNPVRESLRNFQTAIGMPEKSDRSDFTREAILRNLQSLNGEELLSNYTFSLTRDPAAYSRISEETRTAAENWLDELRACVTGKNGLFSNEFDPETYVDGFIEFAGGSRITDILGLNVRTENADYFFRQENVVVELKILKTDFLETNRDKLQAARNELLKKIKITPGMILGTDKTYPRELFDAHFLILRDALQKITKKANKQIKNSKTLLNAPDAQGIVIFLVDGFYSVSPMLTIELLHEPVSRQYSAVDAFIFVTFRRKVTLDLGDGPFDYFVFQPRYKPDFPESLPDFINRFGAQWFAYLQRLSGKRFNKHILSYDPLGLAGGIWK
jgi:hypothetical protein